MELKRVVVTGIGALTPIGNNAKEFWDGLLKGKSGAAPITHFDTSKFKTQFACEIKNLQVEDFIDRKEINIDLALGFMSEENRLTRQQLILQTQQGFAQAMMQLNPEVPEMFFKLRKSFEDTLYVLGVKDCDAYLPTFEEAAKLAQAKAQQGPGVQEQEIQSKVDLNKAKTQESQTVAALNMKKAEDIDMDNFFEMEAMKKGKLSAVQVD